MTNLDPGYSVIADLFLEIDSAVDELKNKLAVPSRTNKQGTRNSKHVKQTSEKICPRMHTTDEAWLGKAARLPVHRNLILRLPKSESENSEFLHSKDEFENSESGLDSVKYNSVASQLAKIEQNEKETGERLRSSSTFRNNTGNCISFVRALCYSTESQNRVVHNENISPSLLTLTGTRLFQKNNDEENPKDSRREEKHLSLDTSIPNQTQDTLLNNLPELLDQLVGEWLSGGLIEKYMQQELS